MHLNIQKVESGIYYIYGISFPVQLIVTSRLSVEENLWLASLTDDLDDSEQAKMLLEEYEVHKQENIYQSMMGIIINANQKLFREEGHMCEAIYRIAREKLQDEFERIEAEGELRGKEQALIALVKDGILSAAEAAKRLSISEDELFQKMKKPGVPFESIKAEFMQDKEFKKEYEKLTAN